MAGGCGVAGVGVLAACTDRPAATGSSGSVLTVTTGASTPFVAVFNPYAPSNSAATDGMIPEPLYFFDTVDATKISPWHRGVRGRVDHTAGHDAHREPALLLRHA